MKSTSSQGLTTKSPPLQPHLAPLSPLLIVLQSPGPFLSFEDVTFFPASGPLHWLHILLGNPPHLHTIVSFLTFRSHLQSDFLRDIFLDHPISLAHLTPVVLLDLLYTVFLMAV